MSFQFETKEVDFFGALRPLIPKAIKIAHLCYEQVLIKDGRIKEGEYDETKGLDGLFVSELEISDEGRGFRLEGRAFASTPQVEDLDNAINAIQSMLSNLDLYDSKPFPDEGLRASIVIETAFFPPGSFSVSVLVSRSNDGKYHGYVSADYKVLVYSLEEAKSHLTESSFIRNQTYEELLQQVQQARSNSEKKMTLENLASLLVKDLGLEVKYVDKRGIDNEIDIFVINESQDSFLKQLGNPILVECKNWNEPMSARAIRDFAGKLRDKNLDTGIVISMKGITGTENTAAKASIRTLLSRDKIRIIALDEEDLKRISKGKSFRSLLRDRFYELMTY